MTIEIKGCVVDRRTGNRAAALWADVRNGNRPLARRYEHADVHGGFRIEIGEEVLGRSLRDESAKLILNVLRDDRTELRVNNGCAVE